MYEMKNGGNEGEKEGVSKNVGVAPKVTYKPQTCTEGGRKNRRSSMNWEELLGSLPGAAGGLKKEREKAELVKVLKTRRASLGKCGSRITREKHFCCVLPSQQGPPDHCPPLSLPLTSPFCIYSVYLSLLGII